mmetsp:Transcript_1459/g.2397  ORF Transcript_1459/g.2397 Transcript_1459/m.2397 type:complete len:500 (-) Transcript_1459:434-1933(-)
MSDKPAEELPTPAAPVATAGESVDETVPPIAPAQPVTTSKDPAAIAAAVAAAKKKRLEDQQNQGKIENDNPSSAVDVKSLTDAQLMKYVQDREIAKILERQERKRLKGKDVPKEHKFWNTQPVLSLTEKVDQEENAAIDTTTTLADIRKEPLNMPCGFEWCSFDIMDPVQAEEVYVLLRDNYVEDDECTFRFDYSIPFLQWALTQPGYLPEWHVGVRNAKTGSLMGCITAVPVHIRVFDEVQPMAEINFLCVHKKLRTKRLAPVLIKEITRRVNVTDRWQAVYTAGVVLPKPVGRCRYYHRSLNPKKLIEARFSSLPPKTTMQSHLKSLKLPPRPLNHHLRAMVPEDVPAVHKLLTEYLSETTQLAQMYTIEDVAHNLLPRDGVVNSYVVQSDDGTVTDMCSFYHLPSSVIGNTQHSRLLAVYSYYNVARTVTITELMRDLLVLARNEGADVFNCLDLMENSKFFDELKFGYGDGCLQYYVYNWKCAEMECKDVGLVLV